MSDDYHEITYIDASTGTVNFSFKFESEFVSSAGTAINLDNYLPNSIYGIISSTGNYRFGFISLSTKYAFAYN